MGSIELQQKIIPQDTQRSELSDDEAIIPQNVNNIESFADVPPNGGYGWVCTFCAFMITVHTWGVSSAWGVLLAHFLLHSTFPGATHMDYAFIGGLSISTCLLIGPLVTKTYKTIGTTFTQLLGSVLVFAALFGASHATKIWHLFLSQGVCFGIGMGFLYLTSMAVLPPWFSTKRSLAIGIAASGSGLGGLIYNLGAGSAIQTLGVETTYRILAFCSLGANVVSSLLMKERKQARPETPQRTVNYRDLSHFEVFLLILWGVATEFGYVTLWYSLPNYASSIGLNPQQGSVAGAIMNLGLVIGRPTVGYASDTFGRITISMVMTALCGFLCFAIWIPAHSYALLLVFAVLVGTVCGTFWGTITPVMVEVVGLNRLPSTFVLICLALVIPTTVAEPIALSLVATSGYLSTQVYVACMFILGAVSLLILRSWKFYELEMKALREREDDGVTSHALAAVPSYFAWVRPSKLFLHGRV